MKRFLLTLLLVVLAGTAMATDSGLYYDKDRNGEGISLHRDGDRIVFFLFTYGGADQEIEVSIGPWVSPLDPLEEPLNGQRWFLGTGDLVNGVVEGELYQAAGINYPLRLQPNPVGDTVVVADYELTAVENGWELTVVPSDDSPLADDDPLFTVEWVFDTRLFVSGD